MLEIRSVAVGDRDLIQSGSDSPSIALSAPPGFENIRIVKNDCRNKQKKEAWKDQSGQTAEEWSDCKASRLEDELSESDEDVSETWEASAETGMVAENETVALEFLKKNAEERGHQKSEPSQYRIRGRKKSLNGEVGVLNSVN
ncbi:hypothetical protein PIB30_107769 [Stylosanthes scabra]|uniref:Uncharacterized protein n=1 Tax=Stylosanthes scabra TaxID=79078 RepID=A0ABU6RZQ7_9FABA|nr:hypothetical protein [Stylosanthes scabra]